MESLSAENGELYVALSLSTTDSMLRLELLRHVAAKGTKESRTFLVNLSISQEPLRGRFEAAIALASRQTSVESEVASLIGIDHLLELDSGVATQLAKVAGGCLPEAIVVQYAERLRVDPERRVLLLALGIGAKQRAYPLAAIKGMLPSQSPVLGVFGPANGDIPRNCLTELGGHEEVQAIGRAFAAWIYKDEG